MKSIERLGPWPARVLWVALALVAAVPVGDALDGRTTAVRAVVLALLWTGWVAGSVALLVPRSSALTVMRIVVPAGTASMVAAVAAGSEAHALDAVAVAVAAGAAVAVLVPWVGEAWVDGSSYGSERRFLLRPPAVLSYLLVPVTWAVVVFGAVAGPLLVASGRPVAGVPVTVLGWIAAGAGARSLHQLSRRWLVLVPAGLVLHDHLVMPEPQLFLRHAIARLAPAPADSRAEDLTGGAPGLALQLDLAEPVELLLRTATRGAATHERTAVLFTPSRPGHVLETAAARRLPVG